MNALKTVLPALTLTASLTAQVAPDTLLYTTLQRELAACAMLPSLQSIEPRSILCVMPNPQAAECAEKFLPDNGLLTLLGDENGDNDIWEDGRPKHVDALQWRPYLGAQRNQRDLYFSPSTDLDDCISGQVFHDGSVGRIEADGKFAFFLTEDQIKSVFGIPSAEDIDVDAIAVDEASMLIYISFEDIESVLTTNAGAIMVDDGAILAIPAAALGEPATTMANTGLLVATEPQVDNLVANSGVWNRAGGPALVVGDLDGLDVEGGVYQNAWGNWTNLRFCGEQLTGGIVLNTAPFGAGRGRVAVMNGQALGRVGNTTTGQQVGLDATAPHAYSLNALEDMTEVRLCHFVLDTPAPQVNGGQNAVVEVGGAVPGMAWLLFAANFDAPCVVHPMLGAFPNSCFPEVILFQAAFGPFPINAAGQGQVVIPLPVVSGFDLVFQAVGGAAAIQLSTPLTIEIL